MAAQAAQRSNSLSVTSLFMHAKSDLQFVVSAATPAVPAPKSARYLLRLLSLCAAP